MPPKKFLPTWRQLRPTSPSTMKFPQLTYLFSSVFLSVRSSRYVVRSLIVSDDVVPLIVSSRKISPMQSSNLFHKRCVVSLGRLLRSMRQRPMLMLREQTTTSSSWSSSNRWRSNCSSHLARGEFLLLYFSFPNLNGKVSSVNGRVIHHVKAHDYLNLTNGSSPASVAGNPFASTSRIVTTELQICDFNRFEASASLGLRWKYWK